MKELPLADQVAAGFFAGGEAGSEWLGAVGESGSLLFFFFFAEGSILGVREIFGTGDMTGVEEVGVMGNSFPPTRVRSASTGKERVTQV